MLVMMRCCTDCVLSSLQIQVELAENTDSLKGAVVDLKRAIYLAPQSACAAYSLAKTYHWLACLMECFYTKALRAFEKAFDKFPFYGDGLVFYAMVSG